MQISLCFAPTPVLQQYEMAEWLHFVSVLTSGQYRPFCLQSALSDIGSRAVSSCANQLYVLLGTS